MVNEVVMYQSMFLLGVIMFGFFAVSFSNYSEYAEEITIDNNMDRVLQEIGQELVSLVEKARSLRGTNGNISLTVSLSLPSDFASEPYTIEIVNQNGLAQLVAIVDGEERASHSLELLSGNNPNSGEIAFSGQIVSSSALNQIRYQWDNSPLIETIELIS